jgi:hypothetical protein
MEGPNVQSDGRTRLTRRSSAPRTQLVQPLLAPPTKPRPKTTTERRRGYGSRPTLDRKSMAPSADRDGFRRTDRRAPSRLVPTRASGATRYNMHLSLGSHCIPGSLPAWLHLRRRDVSATLALLTEPRIPNQQFGRQIQHKYKVTVTANTYPWIETMKPYMTIILGSDALGGTTLALLFAAWAPSTSSTYGNAIRRHFDFCEEHRLEPLAATPAHMSRYVVWLGQLGTIKASRVCNLTCRQSTASSRTTNSKRKPSAT